MIIYSFLIKYDKISKMKLIFEIFLFIILIIKTFSITVYHCSNMDFLYEQCMLNYTDKNGDTHILLKKCPENKICQPTRDYSMGFCIYNIKELPPGHYCYYSSECSTRICIDYICIGYGHNRYCNPDKKECGNHLTCKKTLDNKEKRYVYKCLPVTKIYTTCENNDDCDFNLVCSYYQKNSKIKNDFNTTLTINNKNFNNLNQIKNYFNSSEYLNLAKNKYCINLSSMKNGDITNEEKACETGQLIPIEYSSGKFEYICGSKKRIIKNCNKYNKCIIEVDLGLEKNIEIEQDCIFSNIGNSICPLDQKEKAWKNYLNVFNKYYEENRVVLNEKFHVSYDKFTLKNKEVMEAFWQYYDWIHNIEGDECAKDYFFIKNKAYFIIYNIYYYFLILLLNILFL